jgi:amino acid transporter
MVLSVWLYAVTVLTGLILLGLIIDLGGGPDHDRRGFRVSLL